MFQYKTNPNSCFSARRYTTNQSLSSSVSTTIIFNDFTYLTDFQYNNSNGIFTCTIPGFYSFSTSVRLISSSSMTIAFISFLKNSLEIRGQEFQGISTTIIAMAQTYNTYLNVGDTIRVNAAAYTSNSSNVILDVFSDAFELGHFSGFKIV